MQSSRKQNDNKLKQRKHDEIHLFYFYRKVLLQTQTKFKINPSIEHSTVNIDRNIIWPHRVRVERGRLSCYDDHTKKISKF